MHHRLKTIGLRDNLSLYLAAKDLAQRVIASRSEYGHEGGYCELLDIKQNPLSVAHFKSLIVPDDVGQNSFKQIRYQELREQLRHSIPSQHGRKVYIRRGITGAPATRTYRKNLSL